MITEQELEDRDLHEMHLDILIEEFEEFKDGYVRMESWVAGVDEDNLQEAVDNPCGTAACIAGKAGLMRRFHEMGFQ